MDDNVERARGYFAVAARGMQPAGVRQSNMRAVSRVIARTPGVSNAEIARLTGLAPQTVSAVLTSLDDAGLLTRGPARRPWPARHPDLSECQGRFRNRH